MKLISVVTPCYNEEANVEEIHKQVKAIFAEIPNYRYEHIFIDNASTDNTVAILRKIAEQDPYTKIIVNARNFGHIRSPYHAILETNGDATILIVADLQDPPTMIKEFIKKWEEGYKIVVGVKPESQESKLMFTIRRAYYNFVTRIADVKLIKNFTGFGLYDKEVVNILRNYKDPYPYFRGLIAEIGLEIAEVPYNQPRRARGVTKNNFYSLYDMAMLGITSHSKIPLRLATMAGFSLSLLSFLISCVFFILKLLFWNSFNLGVAPILIGLFFFSSIQLFFIGLLGEYIASIHTRVIKRPLVVEKERINFSQ
ncbi:glycosyltransferase family 2 protein [Legionella micdadei]|uniref:Glycosyl transferase family 2 n=1 Tax=Legionella micdadei TaxID=451 RepID=A0A098GK21_LEGMI|nr:glycosyltransferase family 2 protein [Legionella micdadei]ARG98733.1 glycosyltransferase [Legionella micdadei]ARH01452.1 glycosyltransferase [Legionella micdadei]KTD28953.1 glycosyl transferase, group 2 family protein [Legionella micdadei]NSL17165.1 glycosyltransferase family 2 protein [Legionella micdadei]CEG62335.1 Glycosyl transferase family 2 [Legionella micdadei]